MGIILKILELWLSCIQNIRNQKNRDRLTNDSVSLVCSNCAGGVLYHWLGLKFNSPFINLFMSNNDFLFAMENFDDFLRTPIIEDQGTEKGYPVGIGYGGIKINFMHYLSFIEAEKIWEKRKLRIQKDNLAVMLTNWNGDSDVVKRFDKLPFNNKVIFTTKPFLQYNSAYYIRRWKREYKGTPMNLWRTENIITGKRFIDQFDYVSFLNNSIRKL